MKSTINISLDTEIIENLRKEDNYSDLINREMKGYYDADKTENLTILKQTLVKTKHILKINNRKKRLIENKLLKIREKEQKIMEKIKINRNELIQKIKQDRKNRQSAGRRVRYYVSVEEEADRILKGGEGYGKI